MDNSTSRICSFPTVELSCVSVADRVALVHDLFERAMGLPPRVVCLGSLADELCRFEDWAVRMCIVSTDDAAANICWEQRLQDSRQTATLHAIHHHLDAAARALRADGLQQGSPVAAVEYFLSPTRGTMRRRQRRQRRLPPARVRCEMRDEEVEELLVTAGWENGPLRRLWHENNGLIERRIQPAVHGLWAVLHQCERSIQEAEAEADAEYWADDENLCTDGDEHDGLASS